MSSKHSARRTWASAGGLALLLACAACVSSESVSNSVSDSVGSLSDSVGALSRSLSRSSESSFGDDDVAARAFERDVRAVTAAGVRAGVGGPELMRDLGRVAREHGVIHWESLPVTYRGIGGGLRDAGVGEADMQRFGAAFAPGQRRALDWVLEGYRS